MKRGTQRYRSHLNHEMLAFHFFRLLNNLFNSILCIIFFASVKIYGSQPLQIFLACFLSIIGKTTIIFCFLYLITTTSIFLDSLKGALL